MSAELVRQALELVDGSYKANSGKKKHKKGKEVFGLLSQKDKLIVKKTNGKKPEKVNLLSTNTKYTILDARKQHKSKEEIYKENLKKVKLIREASKIQLDKTVLRQIIDRGVLKRPVKARPKTKKQKKTAFTEEDFKKFEEEYFE